MSWNKLLTLWVFFASTASATGELQNYTAICTDFVKESQRSLHSLTEFIHKKDRKQIQDRYSKMLKLSVSNCQNPKVRKKLDHIFREYLSVGERKIALLIPDGSLSGAVYAKMLNKMARDAKLDWTIKKYQTAKIGGTNKSKTLQSMAKAILIDGADIIVGGIGRQQAEKIKTVANHLRIPSFLLHSNVNTIGGTKSPEDDLSFRIAPHPSSLAKRLLEVAKQRGIKKIAILGTESAIDAQFAKSFKLAAQQPSFEIVKEIKYRGQETEQLDLAVRTLLEIDRDKRAEEYEQLVKDRQKAAKEAGERFRLEGVYLEPKVDFDAVFIPDDFRQTRFIAKMLKFYGLKETALLGGPRWRAKEMVQPYDTFFKHSFFADNVGYYSDTTEYTKNLLGIEENYFLSPKKTMFFDMAIVAERMIQSLQNLELESKTRAEMLTSWKENQKTTETVSEKVPAKMWNWKAYVFGFEPGTIALKSRPLQAKIGSKSTVNKIPQ